MLVMSQINGGDKLIWRSEVDAKRFLTEANGERFQKALDNPARYARWALLAPGSALAERYEISDLKARGYSVVWSTPDLAFAILRRGACVTLLGMDGGSTPAQRLLSRRQRVVLAVILVLSVAVAVMDNMPGPSSRLRSQRSCTSSWVGSRAWLVHDAWRRADTGRPLLPDCPTKSCRVTRCSCRSTGGQRARAAAHAPSRLEYPRTASRSCCICEADDDETIAAIEARRPARPVPPRRRARTEPAHEAERMQLRPRCSATASCA